MNLYLCSFTKVIHTYPDRTDRYPNQLRLVRAESSVEALMKLEKAEENPEENPDPYGMSIRVEDLHCWETIE